ncbi:MAG: tRNA (adenosine(37)-N6)-threonylcarbamoyltransferase complex dimerization subunit type 1 TsaB [Cyclobacteriaceae bacterium]
MANILSIDTSTKVCSVALHNSGALVAGQSYHLQQSHSSLLPGIIKQLLDNCEFEMASLDAVALSAGPGSYTGLRIGTATAKGLCFALNLPLISIDTLDTMIDQVFPLINEESALFCPMIDARRMEVYCKLINQSRQVLRDTSPVVVDEDTFSEFRNVPLYLFGNGASKLRDLFKKYNTHHVPNIHPSAANMGTISYEKFQKGLFEDLAYFEPDYLKEFQTKAPVKKKLV